MSTRLIINEKERKKLNDGLGANVEVIYNKGFAPKLHERGLYASCDGTVRYTRELYVPPPDTIEVQFVIFSKHSFTWPTCSFCPSGLISKLNDKLHFRL